MKIISYPDVSIIVPVYNSEQFLQRCVESILGQSITNIELILVNDGSSDKSGILCDYYAKKDPRVKVIHQRNSGVSSARNKGLDVARGKYISFVDSDDEITLQFIQRGIKLIGEAELYLCGIEMLMPNKENDFSKEIYCIDKSNLMLAKEYMEQAWKTVPALCFCSPWCKIYKKKVIERYGLRFDERLSYGEDTLFNLEYIERINHVFVDSEVCYRYYRENPESLYSRYRPEVYEVHSYVYKKWIDVVEKMGCSRSTRQYWNQKYIKIVMAAIPHVFKNSKNVIERKEVIRKVANNNELKCYGSKFDAHLGQKIIYYALRHELLEFVYFVYKVRYR